MLRDEVVISQMRIGAADAVDLLVLAVPERLVRIEAPCPFQQALAAQDFVDAGNATGETIGGVEERGIRVGQFHIATQHFRGNRIAGLDDATALGVEFDGPLRPDRPMAEQAADKAPLNCPASHVEAKGRQQIHDDIVIVACIERDVFAVRFGDGADDLDGLVAIEWRDLDGDDVSISANRRQNE